MTRGPTGQGDAELASKYTLKLESMQAALAMEEGLVTFAVLDEAGDIIASANVGRKGDDTGRIAALIVQDDLPARGVRKLSLNALSTRTATAVVVQEPGIPGELARRARFRATLRLLPRARFQRTSALLKCQRTPMRAGESAAKLQAK
ncbi:hypothetical protein MY11210_005412 [Beauveria gryllotalpidicola]